MKIETLLLRTTPALLVVGLVLFVMWNRYEIVPGSENSPALKFDRLTGDAWPLGHSRTVPMQWITIEKAVAKPEQSEGSRPIPAPAKSYLTSRDIEVMDSIVNAHKRREGGN